MIHRRSAPRSATLPSRPPTALRPSIQPGACESCHIAGQRHSGAPFQTWHEAGRNFLAVRGEGRFTICDDQLWCYGDWSDVAEFRQRYAQGDLAVWVGRGVMTSVQLRVLKCRPYSLRVQREAVRPPRFLSLSANRRLRVLGHMAEFAFDWEHEGISVESAIERGMHNVLEASK